MNREHALATLDRRLLDEFSRRTVAGLRQTLPLRLALPMIEPFLAANVAKEVRKDALTIRRAAALLAAGESPGPEAAQDLLAAAHAIDDEFLARIAGFPVHIAIRYTDIEALRRRRIELGLDTAYRILRAWGERRRLREAFAGAEFGQRLAAILQLYVEETLALSRSVRLPPLLAPLREGIAQVLGAAMHEAAVKLTTSAAAEER